ncbi:MAG: hypothetical protein WA667_18395 [Candidatus Nitrosopolaris sp.]
MIHLDHRYGEKEDKSLQNFNLEGFKAITNAELCKDMLLNHYPQSGIKLHAFIESSNSIESQSSILYNCIKALLRKYLKIPHPNILAERVQAVAN